MFRDESLEDRQRNELEALQAIYEDLKDLRTKSAWNQWTPLNVSITLTPHQGSSGTQEFYVRVDLHIICNHLYPNSVPKISLENPKGLSNTLLSELQEELEKRANKLKGEEMIFLLSQDVQEFLHKHNKPASKSFYDEMLKLQKEREEKERLAKEMEQNQQRQHYMETQKRLKEMQESELRIERESRRISENEDDCDSIKRKSKESSKDNDFLCQHKKTELIKFSTRSVQRGCCIKHSPDHCKFQGIDMESGQVLFVSAWIFQNIKDIQQVKKQMNSIEQELNYLTTLKHPNLTRYFGIKHQVFKNSVTVYLLEEFVSGLNFSSLFLCRDSKGEVNFLKHIARGVVTALDYLHRNKVVHKDIKETSVYLSDNGVVKVAHCSIYKRISDLNSQSHKNYGKKTDIFKFGLLLLSVLKGCPVSEEDLDPPSGIDSKLQDFLSRCLEKDESHRHSAAQLLGHRLFHDSDQSPPKTEKKELDISHDLNVYDQLILANDMSRINKEFELIGSIGSGAFGSVIKVRNKLDGCDYAIKRIKLNTKNEVLTKKIIREVKLLSRLNHENVVRYYNSWIEKATIKKENNTGSESLMEKTRPGPERKDKLNLNEHLEAFAPTVKSVEFSVTYDSVSQGHFVPPDDESSDEDELSESGFQLEDSDSDDIVFERDSDSINTEMEHNSEELSKSSTSFESSTIDPVTNAKSKEIVNQINFMYIQMEFCEKSNLQTAIANNLYLDKDRYQRLFREIVEGLSHIHLQGMIHRDLKPANIFLDSGDHVKIGDFGLATTSIISKPTENTSSNSPEKVDKEDTADESKTGYVGTALYAAPEISSKTKIYNEKVDIYSLGIILFEMCYRSINTGMERIEILKALRSKEIIFPKDASTILTEKQIVFIRWLLTHDTSKRPTCMEISKSQYMPPAVLDDLKFRDLVTHTLNHRELQGYQSLIKSCFDQPKNPNKDLFEKGLSLERLQLREFVRKICVKIFEQHGGQNLITPLLIPRNKFYENFDNCVKLMDHHGCIVCLSYDLRVPFAKYVACNEITTLRRYSIDRVFTERKLLGAHPKEQVHCAFDIVTATSDSLMPDAEIVYIVSEILNYIFGSEKDCFIIRLNHTKLLLAIFQHCGIKDGHNEVHRKLYDYQEGKISKSDLQDFFIYLKLPDNMINLLFSFINSDIEVSKSFDHFEKITRNRTEAGKLAKKILQDLKLVIYYIQAFGVKFDMRVSPGLVHKVNGYSGLIFEFIYKVPKDSISPDLPQTKVSKNDKSKKKKKLMEVVAVGGRYDSMIAPFRPNKDTKQCAVGVSISSDRLVDALQRQPSGELPRMDSIDIAVCSIGEKQMVEEKAKVLRNLWKANLRCTLIEGSNLTEIQNQVTDLKINHIVILKDNEPGTVIVKSLCTERFQDHKFTIKQLAENMQLIIQNSKAGGQENIPPSLLARSDSKTNCTEHNSHLEVLIVMSSDRDKLNNNTRKRFETQISSVLEGVLQKLNGLVVALGLFIDINVMKMLSCQLEYQSDADFQKNSKHKKYLYQICDVIHGLKIERKNENITIVLFCLPGTDYRVIV
ncbi:eukaryotic translation initiation factor 2 alpha kinase Gcn2 isoform X2 [Leptinotarsa decemlineata]|uniref:eukaryotic translation initiation factor 2 alpha kinase Gcn2 isoform X2 n=1 Tax=Leptinotarsa decemlineata TaxID=7539 RepID=UPI003D307038